MPNKSMLESNFDILRPVTKEELVASITYISSALSPDDPCKTSFVKDIKNAWIDYFEYMFEHMFLGRTLPRCI